MKKIVHKSATSSHYNKEAEHYDEFNEKNSAIINSFLEALFKQHKIKTVLDLTCGTGSQVFWLSKKGFDVTGYDINAKMLKIAKEKAQRTHSNIKFCKGDMRVVQAGAFDAVITVFNAIGHLTKQDFIKAIKNIHANLKPGGLYVFDIFNLDYLLRKDNITTLTIDRLKKLNNRIVREIQYSTITSEGVLASYDIYYAQNGRETPKISKAFQTLQIYNKFQLVNILKTNNFKVIKQCDIDGGRFYNTNTPRVLTIAKKQTLPL